MVYITSIKDNRNISYTEIQLVLEDLHNLSNSGCHQLTICLSDSRTLTIITECDTSNQWNVWQNLAAKLDKFMKDVFGFCEYDSEIVMASYNDYQLKLFEMFRHHFHVTNPADEVLAGYEKFVEGGLNYFNDVMCSVAVDNGLVIPSHIAPNLPKHDYYNIIRLLYNVVDGNSPYVKVCWHDEYIHDDFRFKPACWVEDNNKDKFVFIIYSYMDEETVDTFVITGKERYRKFKLLLTKYKVLDRCED